MADPNQDPHSGETPTARTLTDIRRYAEAVTRDEVSPVDRSNDPAAPQPAPMQRGSLAYNWASCEFTPPLGRHLQLRIEHDPRNGALSIAWHYTEPREGDVHVYLDPEQTTAGRESTGAICVLGGTALYFANTGSVDYESMAGVAHYAALPSAPGWLFGADFADGTDGMGEFLPLFPTHEAIRRYIDGAIERLNNGESSLAPGEGRDDFLQRFYAMYAEGAPEFLRALMDGMAAAAGLQPLDSWVQNNP